MPNVYDVVLTDKITLSFAAEQKRLIAQQQLPNTIGGQVMAVCRRNHWTAPVHMAQIVDTLYQALRVSAWQWKPNQAGADGRAVLDGRIHQGECQYLAAALKALLVAPAPFGFQINPALMKVETYDGPSHDGFIAYHQPPSGGWFGLFPNVYNEPWKGFHNLYHWGDHKVLQYAGRFWDVCYNTSYLQLVDMAYIRLGPLNSRLNNGTFTGEQTGPCPADPALNNKFWRLPAANSPAQQAQAKVEGPHDKTQYWFWQ